MKILYVLFINQKQQGGDHGNTYQHYQGTTIQSQLD